jgi:acetylglutamate kinase
MKPVVVIKLGGSSLDSSETILKLATLIRGFQKRKYHVVVVHGGGPAINNELSLRKIKWQFINGQRQTTQEMMSVIDEVLAKKVNSELVETLKRSSVNAIGLSGADDQILYCKRASAELIQVGQVEIVNTFGLKDMWNNFADKVPVIAPIGYGENSEKFNINADWAASKLAIELNAKKLIFLTDQNGILDQNGALVQKADSSLINNMISDGVISGGMLTKVRAMMKAIEHGVKFVSVLNASSAVKALAQKTEGTIMSEFYSKKEVNFERTQQ